MDLINTILSALLAYPDSDRVINPYLNTDCLNNLSVYLETLIAQPYSGHLLVGEAAGYRGAALTGIPFTSPRVLRSASHPFLARMRDQLAIDGDVSESTATIVWSQLGSCERVPAMWNVFPYHPHRPGEPQTNRPPTGEELEAGRHVAALIIELLAPRVLVGIGRIAQRALAEWHRETPRIDIRHPSHGGKREFSAGLRSAGITS